jgi:hypothetical protein
MNDRRGAAPSNYHFKHDPDALPILSRLMAASGDIDPGAPASVFALRAHFDELVGSREIGDLLRTEVRQLDEDFGHVPSGFSGGTMLLAQSEAVAVTATLMDARHGASPHIYSPVADAIYGNLGPGVFPVCVHERPEGADILALDRTQRLTLQPCREFAPGDTFAVRAARDVPEYRCVERTLILKLTCRTGPPLVWVYDKASGLPRMASSGSLAASRMQMMLRTLVALHGEGGDEAGRARSVDAIERLAGHDFHFLRWTAIQSLCALDAERGLRHLRDARADPHPHVAHAAARALEKLNIH